MTMEQPHSNRYKKSKWEESPVITLFVLILVILLTEAVISLFIHTIAANLSLVAQIFVDVFLLLFLLFPLLYTFVLNPLLRQISIRRHAEIARDRCEECSRIMIESLRDLTWEIDGELRVSHLGPALSSVIGYRAEEISGSAAIDFLSDASQQTFRNVLADALAEQQKSGARSVIRTDEFELLCKDGRPVWAEVTATVIFDNDNRLERIIGVFRDISDRKQAEHSLQQAHLLLRKTIDSLNEGVFIVTTQSRTIQEINICAEKMFGYTREELIGAHTKILHLNEEMYQWFGSEILRAYEETGYFQTNYQMKRKDGTVFPSEHFVSPIIAEDGSYLCHVCVVRDISERIQIEESLAEAISVLEERKAFVESIITNLQSGIIVTDLALQITMANPYVQGVCQMATAEIAGANLKDLCPEIAAQIAAGSTSGEIVAHFGTTELTVGFSLLDLKNADKEKVGHIVNFRDLTEIVRIRSDIRQKERLSAMGEVVARVAHEMRNPLCGMTTVGQILDMELTLSPPHRQLMDSFMKESRRLNNLVQDLLDGTRELRLRKRIININQVIEASLQVCQMFINEKNIALSWDRPDSELLLLADPEKLEQVFVNLIHNATEASEPGGKIEIVLESLDQGISVVLSDAGHGIPENILPSIFDVFFTSKKSGTGMGLSISRNIAEAHGGTLTAENMAGKGARFTLMLPHNGDEP